MDDARLYVPFLQASFLISAHHLISRVLFRVLFVLHKSCPFFSTGCLAGYYYCTVWYSGRRLEEEAETSEVDAAACLRKSCAPWTDRRTCSVCLFFFFIFVFRVFS
ncbi:hypothetical protein PVAP13_7NG379966 [Panicum virgatum]|uniref:Uncharacterized protein n=1 Tax=Panicum virgatum TaxID=38727 RepID=A0A8T0QEU0_PANVG|nr:hypothetical protein PVAP13_7NG379966 [Panicum virgatum]